MSLYVFITQWPTDSCPSTGWCGCPSVRSLRTSLWHSRTRSWWRASSWAYWRGRWCRTRTLWPPWRWRSWIHVVLREGCWTLHNIIVQFNNNMQRHTLLNYHQVSHNHHHWRLKSQECNPQRTTFTLPHRGSIGQFPDVERHVVCVSFAKLEGIVITWNTL